MNDLLDIWARPARDRYMIAGWRQWADAGAASSGLPEYLIEHTQATQIGRIKDGGFYLFQIPGTHHLMRPVVKLHEGYRQSIDENLNEFFYAGDEEHGFYIFVGEEPYRNEAAYAKAFFDAVEELGIKRVAALAGVYGAVPYDKDRNVSCVYSLPHMKQELTKYAVSFSNYEGGATISMYLADQAERRGIEFFRFCAFVPSYDFSQDDVSVQPIAIGEDYKTWHDLMVRLDHMFQLYLDLTELEELSARLLAEWDDKIAQVDQAMPELGVREYFRELDQEFIEQPFVPLSDIWEAELRDLLDDF